MNRITVSGQITNNSDATWTDLNVYLLTSPEPFTRTDELEAASETDPTLEVGGRLLAPGLYSEVGDLAPGSSTNYILSVPRSALEISGASGAYWLGVHVLGANEGLRDSVADGRARTFIPLMERRGPSTSLSLVVPIKAPVRRHVDGALKGLPGWQELLGPEGRLSRLVELSGTSDQVSLTWVVDPAVRDAAQSVAEDNPPLDSGPTDEAAEDEATPAPGESPSPSSPLTDEPDTEEPPLVSAQAEEAATWLDLFRRQADQHAVRRRRRGGAPPGRLRRDGGARARSQRLHPGEPRHRRRSGDRAAHRLPAEPCPVPARRRGPAAALRRGRPGDG